MISTFLFKSCSTEDIAKLLRRQVRTERKNIKDVENSYLKSISSSSNSTLKKQITQFQSCSKSLTDLSPKKMFKWNIIVQNVPNAVPSEHLALWQVLLSTEPFCLPSVAKGKPQLCDLKSNN